MKHNIYTSVDKDGRIFVPSAIRKSINCKQNDVLVIDTSGKDEIRIRKLESLVKEIQSIVASKIDQKVSLVDELIAERRKEFEQEH